MESCGAVLTILTSSCRMRSSRRRWPDTFHADCSSSGFLWSGYNHLTQAISELGATNAPNMNLQAFNFAVFGVLTVSFAVGLVIHNERFRSSAVLIAMYGIGAFLASIFHCDPGCPASGTSVTQILHNLDAVIAFVALAIAPLFFWRSAKTSVTFWHRASVWSLNVANVTIPLAAAYLVIDGFSLSPYTGLLQRIFVGLLYGWMLVLAATLFNANRSAE